MLFVIIVSIGSLALSACNAPASVTPAAATPTIAVAPAAVIHTSAPLPTPTATRRMSPVLAATARARATAGVGGAVTATPYKPSEELSQAIIADWEEMFRAINSYESVSASGRPDEKGWWVEQFNRFYTDEGLAAQLQSVGQMFAPGAMSAPGFIEKAQYTVEVSGCASDVECTLKVHIQSGLFWAFDIGSKSWHQANEIQEPVDWTFSMRYDSSAGSWKVSRGG